MPDPDSRLTRTAGPNVTPMEATPNCRIALHCPTCGPTTTVRVQSHDQCVRCGRVLESCCEGPG